MVTLRRDENAREKKGRYMHPLLSVKYSYRRLDLRSVRLYFSFASLIVSKYTRLVPQKWTLKKKKEREREKKTGTFVSITPVTILQNGGGEGGKKKPTVSRTKNTRRTGNPNRKVLISDGD